jgi:hypothetical protein
VIAMTERLKKFAVLYSLYPDSPYGQWDVVQASFESLEEASDYAVSLKSKGPEKAITCVVETVSTYG